MKIALPERDDAGLQRHRIWRGRRGLINRPAAVSPSPGTNAPAARDEGRLPVRERRRGDRRGRALAVLLDTRTGADRRTRARA